MTTRKKSRGAVGSKPEGKAVPLTAEARARSAALAQFLEESGQHNKAVEQDALTQFIELSRRYDEAVQNAEQGLETLHKLATGDHSGMAESAARELIRILSNTLHQLNQPAGSIGKAVWIGKGSGRRIDFTFSKTWPSVFSHLAQGRDCWPILYYVHRDQREDLTQNVIRGLQVGAGLGINLDGKFSLQKPANAAALRLAEFIRGYQNRKFEGELGLFVEGQKISTQTHPKLRMVLQSFSELPPLTREPKVLKHWQKAGRELVPFLYGENFEKHPALVALTGKRTETGDSVRDKKPASYWQREQIQRAIKSAWKSVAMYI